MQGFITEKKIVGCSDPAVLVRQMIQLLCEDWCRRFGIRLAIAPKEEACEWSVDYDNTIDGEVVVKEIEGGGKHATRGCIEGR